MGIDSNGINRMDAERSDDAALFTNTRNENVGEVSVSLSMGGAAVAVGVRCSRGTILKTSKNVSQTRRVLAVFPYPSYADIFDRNRQDIHAQSDPYGNNS